MEEIIMTTFICTVLFILLVAAVIILFALIGFIAVITHTVLRIKDLIENRIKAKKMVAEIQKEE